MKTHTIHFNRRTQQLTQTVANLPQLAVKQLEKLSLQAAIATLLEALFTSLKSNATQKHLILNCEGIINAELTDFISIFEKKKRIRPSISLNMEACRLANSLATQFNITGNVETYMLSYANPLLTKRIASILHREEKADIIFCDICLIKSAWEEINIVLYDANSNVEGIELIPVAVTGLGFATMYSENKAQFIDRLYNKQLPPEFYPILPESASKELGKKWLHQSTTEALAQAQFTSTIFREAQTAIIICSCAGNVSTDLEEKAQGWLGNRKKWLSEIFDIKCDVFEMSAACAAVSFALLAAKDLLEKSFYQKIMIISVEVASSLEQVSLETLNAISQTNLARPFDVERDGIVLGAGAGAMVLETTASVNARQGKALAVLTSGDTYVNAADCADIDTLQLKALLRKVIATQDIDAVIAHATGTPRGDVAEYNALSTLFNNETPVVSVKGAIGHLLYTSAFPSLVTAFAMFEKNKLPASIGLNNIDKTWETCSLNFFPENKIFLRPIERILINSFGFFGSYSSFVLQRQM